MSDLAEPRRGYIPPEVNRVAVLTHENARLKRQLTEAQEKLAAIRKWYDSMEDDTTLAAIMGERG